MLFCCLLGASHATAGTDTSVKMTLLSSALYTDATQCVMTDQQPHSSEVSPAFDLSHGIHINSAKLRVAHNGPSDGDGAPIYGLVFEFAIEPSLQLALGYVEPFSPQLSWMLHASSPASRLGAWKDSNLQYLPQQYSPSFT